MAAQRPSSTSVRSPESGADHPLVIAAVLVWLSVEVIGDGLVALLGLTGASTTSARASQEVTPS